MVEQTPRNENTDANIPINRLVEAIAGIPNQQRPQASTMLKPLSTNPFFSKGNTKNLNFLMPCFAQCLKCNQRRQDGSD